MFIILKLEPSLYYTRIQIIKSILHVMLLLYFFTYLCSLHSLFLNPMIRSVLNINMLKLF